MNQDNTFGDYVEFIGEFDFINKKLPYILYR